MIEEIEILFNYKGQDILIKRIKNKYQVGIRGNSGIDIWFKTATYNTLKLARTSGREYARIMIDKILVSKRKEMIKNE